MRNLLANVKEPSKVDIAVADPRLATGIRAIDGFENANLHSVSSSSTNVADLFRAIREHLDSLMPETKDSFEKITLGLSHSTYQHKLKFDRSMADVVLVHAVKMLEDIDKDLNVLAMRVREWYGWHFPEMGKLLNDNIAYAKVVITAGKRDNYQNVDLTEILPEEVAETIVGASDKSMGTDLTDGDMQNVQLLASQVVQYNDYRAMLATFVESRMKSIAPNLTALVGWLVGAKLIAHTGNFKSIFQAPASTIQILGSEKALFRALKTKHNTPKYGIIFNSSLVGQASQKNKGKIARKLAAKAALAARIDGEPFLSNRNLEDADEQDEKAEQGDEAEEREIYGVVWRTVLENQLRKMDGKAVLPKGVAVGPDGTVRGPGKFSLKDVISHSDQMDGVVSNGVNGRKRPLIEEVMEPKETANGTERTADQMDVDGSEDEKAMKKRRKEEKAQRKADKAARKAETAAAKAEKEAAQATPVAPAEEAAVGSSKKDKKKDKKSKKEGKDGKEDKKRKREEVDEAEDGSSKKKHKKKKSKAD
jgi:nucleolar protein 58